MEQRQTAAGGEDISRAPWYVGKIQREDCDLAVLAGNVGDFLVRLSSKGDKYVVVVNDHGTPQNFACTVHKGPKKGEGIFAGKKYEGMMNVLMHLRANPLNGKKGQLYYLGKPASEKAWYVGAMDRGECEKTVLAAGKSDYMVRLASNRKQFVIVINDGTGKIVNCPIGIGT